MRLGTQQRGAQARYAQMPIEVQRLMASPWG